MTMIESIIRKNALDTKIRALVIFAQNLADFENTAFSKSFGIKPILTYSFSKYVDGDLYLNYVLTENHTTGKKKETNIGFKIRIYFESFE